MIREAINENKHKEMLEIREQSKKFDKKAREVGEKIRYDNYEKVKKLQNSEAISMQKLKKSNDNKIKSFKERYARDMTQEEILRIQREEEILHLEKLETKLITKLQHTQHLQRAAFKKLENAFSLPLDEYNTKSTTKMASLKGGSPKPHRFTTSSIPKIETPTFSQSKLTSRENSPTKSAKRSKSTTKIFDNSLLEYDPERRMIIRLNKLK